VAFAGIELVRFSGSIGERGVPRDRSRAVIGLAAIGRAAIVVTSAWISLEMADLE
jgi:hypothetical protein